MWWTLTAGEVGTRAGCRVGGIEQSRSWRKRGHFFRVSHCGERPGSLPAGLTALSRNVCDWRTGWGSALSCSLCKIQQSGKATPAASWTVVQYARSSTRRVFLFAFCPGGDNTSLERACCICVSVWVCVGGLRRWGPLLLIIHSSLLVLH